MVKMSPEPNANEFKALLALSGWLHCQMESCMCLLHQLNSSKTRGITTPSLMVRSQQELLQHLHESASWWFETIIYVIYRNYANSCTGLRCQYLHREVKSRLPKHVYNPLNQWLVHGTRVLQEHTWGLAYDMLNEHWRPWGGATSLAFFEGMPSGYARLARSADVICTTGWYSNMPLKAYNPAW